MNSRIISIGDSCNNHCYFCFNRGKIFETNFSAIKTLIHEGFEKGCRQVVFTGQEPTLLPGITDIISEANITGYDVIQLVSNARMFTYRDFAEKIVHAGMTELLFPLLGPDAKTHDAITQSPGSFDQTTRGLRNIQAINRQVESCLNVTPIAGTVVCEENAHLLDKTAAAAYSFDVNHLFFIRMIPVRGHRGLGLSRVKSCLKKALDYADERGMTIYLKGFKPITAFSDRPTIFYEYFLERNRVLLPQEFPSNKVGGT